MEKCWSHRMSGVTIATSLLILNDQSFLLPTTLSKGIGCGGGGGGERRHKRCAF